MRRSTLFAAAAVLTASPVQAGDVVGTVRFRGTVPGAAAIETTKDRGVCGQEIADESLVLSDGRVANVVLVVKGAPAPAPGTLTLDQERCRYRPHVQAGPVGSTLDILNGDALLHSVHGWLGRMTLFDVVTPSRGDRVPTKLARAGLVQIRCDVHAWMSAYVVVSDGPAAVTATDGSFAIRGVPAGTYTVTAWHERLGEKAVPVTVPARGEAKLDLVYGG